MPKPICVKCELECKNVRSGIYVVEMARAMGPYKIWDAMDLYECPDCGRQITYGEGKLSMQHWEEGFDEFYEHLLNMQKRGDAVVVHIYENRRHRTNALIERLNIKEIIKR